MCAVSCVSAPTTDPDRLAPAIPHARTEEGSPLEKLFELGFRGAVVSVRMDGGGLFVPGRSGLREFEQVYIGPLARRVAAEDAEFVLLLVLEGEPEATYEMLRSVLHGHRSVLTRYEMGEVREGRVLVLLAGDVPVEAVLAQTNRYAFVAGGLDVLKNEYSPAFAPWVRMEFEDISTWDGVGEPREIDRLDLQAAAARAHGQDRILLVRGAPARTNVWNALLLGGVDRIEVSDWSEVERLARFLGKR